MVNQDLAPFYCLGVCKRNDRKGEIILTRRPDFGKIEELARQVDLNDTSTIVRTSLSIKVLTG